jgi:hypothetical protein
MPQVISPELARPVHRVPPTVDDALRAGAATLAQASAELISSTTVVVEIGADDVDALYQVATDIASEQRLTVSIRTSVGWCAARFCRSP